MFRKSLFIFLTLYSTTHGFIAYGCGASQLNIMVFNSLEVDDCDIPTTFKIEYVQRIKLIQKTERHLVYYQTCFISIDYLITRCSIFEDAQMTNDGFFSEIIELGTANCKEIHQHKVYHTPLGNIISGLKINQIIFLSDTSGGTLNREGNFESTTFTNSKGS